VYRTEPTNLLSCPRMPTVIVDLVRRSAAFDAGDVAGRLGMVDDLRSRDALTEIRLDAVEGLEDDLLLIYRAAHALDTHDTGAILFRRQPPGAAGDGHPPAVRTLAQVLFDSLRSDAPNPPLMAHVALALRAILPRPENTVGHDTGSVRGGLAHWQERRAVAFMQERLDQSFPVSAVAEACGLSVNHFSRAFRRSLGKPPHRWLLDQRIERARNMLRTTEVPLADIALACGFAEQSHFTRVFARIVGMPPGAWRRSAD
jgi:AraC family transcriptional regulator